MADSPNQRMPTENDTLILKRETAYEKRKKIIALTCILLLHTLHCVAFWTMFLQLWHFLHKYLKVHHPSIVILIFTGVSYWLLTPLGGVMGDVYLGRYKAIFIGTIFELLGTVVFLIAAGIKDHVSTNVLIGLTIVALICIGAGMGFIKSNVVPFGAQQVDTGDFTCVQRFMKWYTWCLNLGQLIAYLPNVYVLNDTKVNGPLIAAGIQVFAVALSIAVFIFGKPKYKMVAPTGKAVIAQIFQFCRKRESTLPVFPDGRHLGLQGRLFARQFFLLIALFSLMIPYEGTYFQLQNTYLNQSKQLSNPSNLPDGFMYIFNPLAVIVGIPLLSYLPIYDRQNPRYFWRFCIGSCFGVMSAFAAGLIQWSLGGKDVHISIYTQIPQFAFVGFGECFTEVAGYEVSYAESPPGIEGIMAAAFTSTFGAGSFLGLALYFFLARDQPVDDPNSKTMWLYFGFAIAIAVTIPFLILYNVMYRIGKYRKYNQVNGRSQESTDSSESKRQRVYYDSQVSDVSSDLSYIGPTAQRDPLFSDTDSAS